MAELRERLLSYQPPLEFRRGLESVNVWRPFIEEMFQLLVETLEEDWPFQRYPEGWAARCLKLQEQIEKALEADVACHYPQRRDSDFGILRGTLGKAAVDPKSLDGREVGLCRSLWKQSEDAYGVIGSPARRDELMRRAKGLETEDDPVRAAVELARNLTDYQQDQGLPSDFEAPHPHLESLVESARERTLEELVKNGAVSSLPQLLGYLPLLRRRGNDDTALRGVVELWWVYFPHECLDGDGRRALNQLLVTDWRLPNRLDEVTPEYLKASSVPPDFYSAYEPLKIEELLSGDSDVRRRWAHFDNLTAGGAFALASLGLQTRNAENSARACLKVCKEALAGEEQRSYRRVLQHRKAGNAWQQALFFREYCKDKLMSEFEQVTDGELLTSWLETK